jgi:4-hydroxybenzoate polyprenyltransferase
MILAAYQVYISRQRVAEDCFRAFLNNNWLGAAIFIGIVLNFWAG